MDFTFSEEQLEYRDSVAVMLAAEVSVSRIRDRWETANGFDEDLWKQLAALGLTSMLSLEASGGMGLSAVDFVLLAQECGRVALPEPLVESTLVSATLLADIYEATNSQDCHEWLSRINEGSALVLVGHEVNPCINFARRADAFLLLQDNEVYLVDADKIEIKTLNSVDPSRRIAELKWKPDAANRIISGKQGATMWQHSLNRGALGTAAQLLGLAESMLEQAVNYSCERKQFGHPIGSNQAVKHLLADCTVKIEYARAVVYQAAYTLANLPNKADGPVSHAKIAAAEAALLSARNSIQVFGAMGYTWECDLHIWAKRTWALDKVWGDSGFHKRRIHKSLLDPAVPIGAGHTFCQDFGKYEELDIASS